MSTRDLKGLLMAIRLYPKPWPVIYGYYGMAYPMAIMAIAGMPIPLSYSLGVFFIVFCLMSITFALNYISDIKGDRLKEDKGNNPIVMGYITSKAALYIALAFALILIVYLIANPLPVFIAFSILGVCVGVTYSFGPRWKESSVGIFIASVFFLGPCMMLFALAYTIYAHVPLYFILYVAFLFAFGLYYEIDHTLYDYWHDMRANFKTFSVRHGRKFTALLHGIFATAVVAFAIYLSYYFNIYSLVIVLITLLLYIYDKYDFRLILVPHGIFFLNGINHPSIILIAALTFPALAMFFYYIACAAIHYIIKLRDIAVMGFAGARSKTAATLRDTIYREFYRR